MDINKFLEKYIEGYLFCDIENMLKIKLEKGQNHGACGYPIMMSILSGMELLGDLLSFDKIEPYKEDKDQASRNFNNYWKNYFQKSNQKYAKSGVANVFKKLVRNGLAHRFLTLPGVYISVHGSENHLTIRKEEKQIQIDARRFYFDFKDSYMRLIKNGIKDKSMMQQRLNEILNQYDEISNELFKNVISNNSFRQAENIISRSSIIHNASSVGAISISVFGMPASATAFSALPTINENKSKKINNKINK